MTNNWPSSEQEKLRLYNQARSRTVAAQSATGVRLDTLGLDDSAPPEYAPPLPAQPAEAYKAPSRPVSMYTAASPDKSTPESPQSGPPASPPTKSVLILSADEKDQLRRRFENRISASPRGQSAMPSSPVAGPSEPPTAEAPVETAGYLSGAEEKEQQRRRFEDAQKCVVSAGRGTAPSSPEAGSSSLPNGNAVPSENAVPYDVIFPAASSSTADPSSDAGPSSSAGPSSDSGPSTSSGPSKEMQGKPANGGLSEKEQMKRYYEARAKVTQAKTRPASAAIEASPPAPITSPAPTNRPVSAAPINEKEQMRRYYEAMERVQRASGGGSASGSIPVAPASAIDSPPKAGASTCTPAPVNGYMSASDEKAMMQKRFEDAQAAVKRNVTPSSQPTTASSVGHQRTASLMSTAPSSPPDSPLIRDSTVRAGKAKATGPMSPTLSFGEGFSYGPPLPLPARPPMEYINLLSPVEESSNRWASILSTNGDAGGSRAK